MYVSLVLQYNNRAEISCVLCFGYVVMYIYQAAGSLMCRTTMINTVS